MNGDDEKWRIVVLKILEERWHDTNRKIYRLIVNSKLAIRQTILLQYVPYNQEQNLHIMHRSEL